MTLLTTKVSLLQLLPCFFVRPLTYLEHLGTQDIFGSDFESTDEEAEKEAQEAGETDVVNEEHGRLRR